jgi:hypothetical protein
MNHSALCPGCDRAAPFPKIHFSGTRPLHAATAGHLLMWNNWIGRRIRDDGRTLLFWGILLCVGAAGIGWESRGNFSQGLAHPYAVNAEDLAAPELVDRVGRHSLTFTSPEVIDTDVTLAYSKRRDKVLARYLTARAGDRWLLVKVPVSDQGSTFTGFLGDISEDEFKKVIERFSEDNEIDPKLILPFCLDGTVDTRRGVIVGLFFLIAFLVPGLVLTARGLRQLRRPETHPLARALQRFGPPAEVANTICWPGEPLRLGPIEFAGDWLVCTSPRAGLTVFRCADLVWVHKLVLTVNRTPLHRLKLYDRLGVLFEGRGRADLIELAVAAITQRLPWLVIGWDERVEKQWQDDPASLVARVEEQRKEWEQKGLKQSET